MGQLCCLSIIYFGSLARAQTTADNQADATTNAAPYVAPSTAPVDSGSAPVSLPQLQGSTPGAPQAQLEDIRPPIFYLHSWLWLWIVLGLLALIALIVLLWRWFRPQKQLSAKSAYELTLEKLEKARGLIREEEPMPYAIFVSETIRSYLGQRFQSPSTRRTTEEFLRQMEADRTTPLAEHRELLRGFLQSCDMVKFARYQPTLNELQQVQQSATSFVIATKPLPDGAQNGKA
jgi:hypothetical protein